LVSLGCSTLRIAPVRTSPFSTAPSAGASGNTAEPERFRDTLHLPAQLGTRAADDYVSALRLLEDREYERAAALFTRLADDPRTPDSLAAESLFYVGECAAAVGRLAHAQASYERLLRRSSLAPPLRERVLLRLGHVLCAQGQGARANELFAQLRQEFPQSRYLPLATCTAVQLPPPTRSGNAP